MENLREDEIIKIMDSVVDIGTKMTTKEINKIAKALSGKIAKGECEHSWEAFSATKGVFETWKCKKCKDYKTIEIKPISNSGECICNPQPYKSGTCPMCRKKINPIYCSCENPKSGSGNDYRDCYICGKPLKPSKEIEKLNLSRFAPDTKDTWHTQMILNIKDKLNELIDRMNI